MLTKAQQSKGPYYLYLPIYENLVLIASRPAMKAQEKHVHMGRLIIAFTAHTLKEGV